jgi:integrase
MSALVMPIETVNKYVTSPVTDSKGNKIPNLVQRNGAYYVSCQVGGKRFLRASPYDGMTQSAAWARKFIADAKAGRWEKLEASKLRTGIASLGDVFAAYRAAAVNQMAIDGKPGPRTVENNIGALGIILKAVHGIEKPDAHTSSLLTRDLIEAYVRGKVESAGADNDRIRRQRVSAASCVRQAKSLFTRWAKSWYDSHGIQLPTNLDDFLKAGKSFKPDKYRIPPVELREATRAAASKAHEARNPIYPAYCLCYDLGMRAGEAKAARWDWIEADAQGNRFMHVCRRPDWQSKNRKDRRIPVTPELWEELQAYRIDGSDYILPEKAPTMRYKLINRRLAAWMREVGWNREKYPKAAHELRKLAGSLWYTKAGLQWAATWLGDTPETVYHYYADATELGPKVEMR